MGDIQEFKCPNCGGAINFDSSSQKMKCPYCDAEFGVNQLKQFNIDLSKEVEESYEWETTAGQDWQEGETDGMRVFLCESCGGEIIGDENTGATSCPYCDNPVVMKGTFSGSLKPDYIIPFKLDKNTAKEKYKAHLKGKFLLPKEFSDENHIDEIKGVYVPFWLFDTDVDGSVRYKATKVRRWSDSSYDYTETKHYSIYRAGHIAFDRIPVDGSTQMPDDLMESVEPFDFSEAVDFNTAYMAGYLGDKYDVDDKESIERANERVKVSTEESFMSTVHGYTTITTESSNLALSNGKTKYAMYPVWILNTTYKGEKYLFGMNGQTGRFVGNLPMDKGKFAGTMAAICAGITAISFLVQYLMF